MIFRLHSGARGLRCRHRDALSLPQFILHGLTFGYQGATLPPGKPASRKRSGQTRKKKFVDARILQEFRTIIGERGLITSQEELKTYECDGLTNFRVVPQAVAAAATRRRSAGSRAHLPSRARFRLSRAVRVRG